MPQTVPMGFEFEDLGDQPGRTLNGGSDGLSPILADQVNDAVVDVLADIADLSSRLDAAEAAAAASVWRHIDKGVESGGAFTIAVPSGFEMLRLYLLGDLDGNGKVRLRVNGDTAAGLHRAGFLVYDAAGALDESLFTEDTAWRLANWGTVSANTATITIYTANVSGAPSYHSVGTRNATSANAQRWSQGWGDTTADRLVSSLNIRPFSDASNQFATCHWRLEGRLIT